MAAAVTHPDKVEINLIVTKQLWSKNLADVFEPVGRLHDLLDSSNVNAENNRKIAFRRRADMAIVQNMRRFKSSERLHCNCIGILINLGVCDCDHYLLGLVEGGGLECCVWSIKKTQKNWPWSSRTAAF
jgi:hypothetical protein